MQNAGYNLDRRFEILCSCGIAAVAFHAAVLFCGGYSPRPVPVLDIAEGTVEVELFEGLPAIDSAASEQTEVAPEEISPPEPEPSPQEPPSAMPILDSPKPTPEPASTPQPASRPPSRKATLKSKSSPQNNSPSAQSAGLPQGSGRKATGTPAYIVRPTASYPAESRSSREEGIVILRITVNASGRPTHVVVLRSSGYPRLDRAALEGGWRCRIRNATNGDQFDAPLRFNLQR